MEVTTGAGGLEMVRLRAAGSSSVDVYSFGAHVTSWRNAAGRENIYTSPTAIFNAKKAIRGGIPICFPQFGKHGPLQQHGFARNSLWSLATPGPSDSPTVTFVLTDSESTRASEWPARFEARLTVTLSADGNELSLEMTVRNDNTDAQAITFTTALHSYFTCDTEKVALAEFSGGRYHDSIDPEEPGKEKTQDGKIVFGIEVDRVYVNAPDLLSIPQVGLSIRKSNMPEAVVWNPHIAKAAALADMPDDDWKSFICIEPARIVEPAVVAAGDTWKCSLVLST